MHAEKNNICRRIGQGGHPGKEDEVVAGFGRLLLNPEPEIEAGAKQKQADKSQKTLNCLSAREISDELGKRGLESTLTIDASKVSPAIARWSRQDEGSQDLRDKKGWHQRTRINCFISPHSHMPGLQHIFSARKP